MIRVWSEHLPLAELRAGSTLSLLAGEDVHPVFAVRPDDDLSEVATTIRRIREAGLEPGIWPLLSLEQGYWPGERNAREWSSAVLDLVDHLENEGAPPDWLAVDLEPPHSQAAHLLRSTYEIPVAAVKLARENMDAERYATAESILEATIAQIQARGIRSLGVTLPLAAHDLRDGEPFWQDMFETPWASIEWDAAGIMAYGSIISGASYGTLRAEDARYLHQRLLRHVAGAFGERAHASIGITGAGVFGDEPSWDDPEELRRDASAAKAAGISDIAIFCLEGIIGRPTPESWLRAVTRARPAEPPSTVRALAITAAGLAARHAARFLFGR